MALVTVRALTTFQHQGRTITTGSPLTIEAIQALALARLRYVSLDRTYNARVLQPDPDPEPDRFPEPDPDPEPLPVRRRRYRRRDLTAEE